MMWYPEGEEELEELIDGYFKQKAEKPAKINGVIVPHAGYIFSGAVAGKAFGMLKGKKAEKAVVLGPTHYYFLDDAVTTGKRQWETPLGKIKVFNNGFYEMDIEQEHSVKNQIPFLQKLGVKEVLPLVVGEISEKQAKEIAENISKIDAVYVFSTDLSHYLPQKNAVEADRQTIKIIEKLDEKKFAKVNACGIFPLMILLHLCKIKKTKPKLVEYKNSGDITGETAGVVGYASFWF